MERRPLRVGINAVPNADPEEVQRFVRSEPQSHSAGHPQSHQGHAPTNEDLPGITSTKRRGRTKPGGVLPVGLIPVTVRLRPELAGALKRASLERQLAGEAVFTQQELVEEALEPWLRRCGYLA